MSHQCVLRFKKEISLAGSSTVLGIWGIPETEAIRDVFFQELLEENGNFKRGLHLYKSVQVVLGKSKDSIHSCWQRMSTLFLHCHLLRAFAIFATLHSNINIDGHTSVDSIGEIRLICQYGWEEHLGNRPLALHVSWLYNILSREQSFIVAQWWKAE